MIVCRFKSSRVVIVHSLLQQIFTYNNRLGISHSCPLWTALTMSVTHSRPLLIVVVGNQVRLSHGVLLSLSPLLLFELGVLRVQKLVEVSNSKAIFGCISLAKSLNCTALMGVRPSCGCHPIHFMWSQLRLV